MSVILTVGRILQDVSLRFTKRLKTT